MLRQIVLDTETTGINYRDGNRIIEIGCVELVGRKLTGNNFHCYINPERDSEEGALAVHGLTTAFLSDKPKFAEIIDDFIEYVSGSEVLIHNAPFDVGFLNAEFARLNRGEFSGIVENVVDTLSLAKQLHPGKRNSLDALCQRYQISNAHRKLHGALLDAELLADVYLAMSRGQNSLTIDEEEVADSGSSNEPQEVIHHEDVPVVRASPEEVLAHQECLALIAKQNKLDPLWNAYAPT